MNMQKAIFMTLIVVVITAATLIFFNQEKGVSTPTSFEECVEAGYPVAESYPRQCRTPDGQMFVEDIGNELEKTDLIQITHPRPSTLVQSPLKITGEARGFWFFEASFPVVLEDKNGQVVAQGIATAQKEWMTEEFVPFEAVLSFNISKETPANLLLKKDNPSGLPEHDDELRVPLTLKPSGEELMTLRVFFSNETSSGDCSAVYSIERSLLKTPAPARAALEELLKGPSSEEKNKGLFTSINSGVKINFLSIQNGVAKVDFSEELDQGVAGSCRVTAIRSQIEKTLLQFGTVQKVEISVNGRTEDILQP